MSQKTPAIKFELTDPAHIAAYNAWIAGKAAKDAAEEAMDAASAILKPALRQQNATVATIAGQTVLRLVESARVTFDATILRKLAPKAAEKAAKRSEFDYLRKG